MDDETTPKFDPRFNPAFQRGFDPRGPIEQSSPEPLARPRNTEPVTQAVPPAASVPAPPAHFVARPTPTPAGVVPSTRTVEPVEDVAVVSVLDDGESQPDAGSRITRNPFLLALGIVAVVLIIAGIWLFASSGAAFNGSEVRSQGDYMSLDALIHTAPLVALLGLATLIGVLFVFAARWRKRR